jgi:hypothetical protein
MSTWATQKESMEKRKRWDDGALDGRAGKRWDEAKVPKLVQPSKQVPRENGRRAIPSTPFWKQIEDAWVSLGIARVRTIRRLPVSTRGSPCSALSCSGLLCRYWRETAESRGFASPFLNCFFDFSSGPWRVFQSGLLPHITNVSLFHFALEFLPILPHLIVVDNTYTLRVCV